MVCVPSNTYLDNLELGTMVYVEALHPRQQFQLCQDISRVDSVLSRRKSLAQGQTQGLLSLKSSIFIIELLFGAIELILRKLI